MSVRAERNAFVAQSAVGRPQRGVGSVMPIWFRRTWQAAWEVLVADRPPAEVAASLGLTVGAVRSARFRVVTRLRHDLADMLDEDL